MTSQEEMPDGFPESTYAALGSVEARINELVYPYATLPKASEECLRKMEAMEGTILACEQIDLITEHVIHGGMYARTIRLPKGAFITGAHMKIPTLLVIHGTANFITEESGIWIEGYGVLPGSAGRKTMLVAHSDVEMTMIFPTQAKTVEEAESEFTDEADRLMSRRSTRDVVVITGE